MLFIQYVQKITNKAKASLFNSFSKNRIKLISFNLSPKAQPFITHLVSITHIDGIEWQAQLIPYWLPDQ